MRPVKTIDEPGNSRFPLDLHLDYQQRLYGVITEMEPRKIGLEEADFLQWLTDIKTEEDVVRETRAAKESEALRDKDAERNECLTGLFQEIRQAARSPIVARRESGLLLKTIIDAYKGLQHQRRSGKTAHIDSLLRDLSTAEAAEALKQLEVDTIVSLLRERNEEFKSLREVRSTVAAGANRLAGQAIRKVNDQTLNTIFCYIEAAYIASDNDPDRQVISRLIDQINQRTRESKISFKRIEGIRKKRLQMKDSAEATDTKAPPKRKRSAATSSTVPPDGTDRGGRAASGAAVGHYGSSRPVCLAPDGTYRGGRDASGAPDGHYGCSRLVCLARDGTDRGGRDASVAPVGHCDADR